LVLLKNVLEWVAYGMAIALLWFAFCFAVGFVVCWFTVFPAIGALLAFGFIN
jgi:hypothetical protein